MKSFGLVITLLISVALLTACTTRQPDETVRETRFLLNTVCTITIFELAEQRDSNGNEKDTTKRELINQSFDLIANYEALFSMTIEGSDVWRINNANGNEVEVSPHTINIIQQGLYYAKLSDGMFDITIGQLSYLWKSSENLPEIKAQLSDAQETVDFRYVEICEDTSTVRLRNPDAKIDLGGIAKGYIADRVSKFLTENGVTSAIIDLGGDIITIGTRPADTQSASRQSTSNAEFQTAQNWRIAVRQPFGMSNGNDESINEIFGIINVSTASITTSGIYERFFEYDGIIYHHILDPFTGFPSNTDVVSATVIAETALAGDVLSSIIILVGSEKAEYLSYQVPGFIGALLIMSNGDYIIFGDVDFAKFD